LILHVFIILVMVYVLNATLLKPINQILQARDQRTKGRMNEAKQILADVSEKLSQYERTLRQARGQAYTFTENERAGAMQERQAKLNEMRERLADSIKREKEGIERQAAEARAALEAESRRLAAEIGARVLSRPLSSVDSN